MNLDQRLTQYALKNKNFILIDLSFPNTQFTEFKKNFEKRLILMPLKQLMAESFASGIASAKKMVIVHGLNENPTAFQDINLNIKILKNDANAKWHEFETQLLQFGASLVLIPCQE